MNNTQKTCAQATGALDIALREARLITDRLLMQTGMPSGCLAAVREAVIASEALGAGGLRRFLALQPTLGATTSESLSLVENIGQPLAVYAAGQHAWLVAQTLVDMLIAEAAYGGAKTLAVHGVTEPAELCVVPSLGARLGATIEVSHGKSGTGEDIVTLTLTDRAPPPKDRTDALLWRVIRAGLPVDATLWWDLYNRSLAALAPDTVVSRRHAGANVVDDSGKVLGRMTDDDTDFSLLRQGASPANAATAAIPAALTSTESPT